MGRKKITTVETQEVETEAIPSNGDLPQEGEVIEPSEQELFDLLETFGPSINKVKISKIEDGRKQWCGTVEPVTLIQGGEEFILKRWGGGKYQIESYLNGRFVKGANRTIEIFGASQPDKNPIPATPAGFEIGILRDQIAQQNLMILKLLEASKAPPAPAQSLTEIVSALASLKALAPAAPDVTTILPTVVEFMKMAKETVTGSNEGGGWLDVIGSAVKQLPSIIGGIAAMRGNGKETAPASEAVLSPEAAEKKLLVAAITQLKAEQRAGMDPSLVAEWICSHMEQPGYRDTVVLLLNRQFETLFQVDSELEKEPLRSWFLRVYTDLRKALIEENAESSNPQSSVDAGRVGSKTDAS